ncbi:DUF3987 domain-containing protein [Methylobacterium sp. NMS14P]|uniref:DUF3987 domain-containing protein n=1 Tax=Methylobacterium sp. NMS14P TaxID=2894310 RepID=UPI00235829F0|nr:DUF3987 domain-containing protein [Methylobacterium sp. NMS14P]WCS26734.1 DUF3987 domain-containing protein [Methylobacterium sp. NMS14P]
MDASNYGPGQPEPQPISEGNVAALASIALPHWDTKNFTTFVIDLINSGRIPLAAIHPATGACHGRTFTLPAELDVMSAWIEERQGTHNLHFALNEPVPQNLQQGKVGRVRREDLSALRGVIVDIDPRPEIEAQPGGLARERERLRGVAKGMIEDPHGPSAIIDSGAGLQVVFLFPKPLPATAENIAAVEAQSRALARLYGGDATNDAAHLFRLPGTVNLPNARKQKRGRKPAAAVGTVFKPWRFHTLDSLVALAPPDEPEQAYPVSAPAFDMSLAWEACGEPGELPADLVVRLTAARAAHPVLDKLLNAERAEQGGRSDRDFAIACASVEGGMSDRAEVAAIVAAYSPDKFEDEDERRGSGRAEAYLAGTVEKAFAKVAKAGPAAMFTPVAGAADEALANTAETCGGGEAPATTGETFRDGDPLDIFGDDDPSDLSTPPEGSLPDVVAPFARTVAVQMGVPESFAAVAAIAALAGTIGNALTLRVREHSAGFQPPASLAIVIVARPGRKKSPTIAAALAPIRTLDSELHQASGAQRAAWRALHCTPKGTPKAGAPPQPPEHQIGVDNATVEKQVRIHADNPTGIIRHPDELSAFLGSMGAYKRGSEGDRGTILTMLDGGPVSFERVGGTVRAESALMGLIASTQPEKIRTLTRDLGSDGFLQRLIPIMDDGAEREPLDVPADPDAVAQYERAVRGMYDIRNTGGGTVYLSPEARAILTATWRRIRALSAIPGASAAWEGHVSKWEGFLYRIALTFHALDTWAILETVPAGPGVPVTAETARRASRFAQFLVRHALRFYGEFYEPAEHTVEAREIAGFLLTHPDKLSVTPRDIEKGRRALQGERRRTLAAMGALENAGWVSVADRGAEGPSRWTVNPHIHERFAAHAAREKVQRAQAQQRLAAALSAKRGLRDA